MAKVECVECGHRVVVGDSSDRQNYVCSKCRRVLAKIKESVIRALGEQQHHMNDAANWIESARVLAASGTLPENVTLRQIKTALAKAAESLAKALGGSKPP